MNALLLKYEPFVEALHEAVMEVCDESTETTAEKWECLKQKIKMKALERSSVLKFDRDMKERDLRKILNQLLAFECKEPGQCKQDMRTIKEKIEQMDKQRYEGAIVPARANALTAGETPTKKALGLEKAHGRRIHVDKISWNGTLGDDNKRIGRAFLEYYQSQFAFQEANVDEFKEVFLGRMPRLSDDTKDRVEGKITEHEAEKAINDLNNGKSPGPDGLSTCFYKPFKKELSPLLKDLFNDAYVHKTLLPSFG